MKRVLVIKLGYSETLDSALSLTTSLGDVLRTTVILHFFKDDYVAWLVDRKALPLLEGNRYIDKIWTYDSDTKSLLKKEKFDVIINFEKLSWVCQFADSLTAKEHLGFRSCHINNDKIYGHSDNTNRLVELSRNLNKRKENNDCWQKILTGALGKKWKGEPYILGYKPDSKIKYDIGFNWTTSNKWTNKAWPKEHWHKLQDLIKNKYSVSWQQGLDSICKYIDWINSCRLIITADTLGLHICLALKKRFIALFGPTLPKEIYFYNYGSFITPEASYKCVPCLKPHCDKETKCIESIYPKRVMEKIEEEIKDG